MFENQRRQSDIKRVVVLTRSAFAGQQRTGAITWSGDISANYEVFRNQVSGGLNFSMSGNPYWTTDCGAFFPFGRNHGMYPLGVKDSAYCELYTRWYQFAAFCPIFRSHGTQTPREVWNFGDKNSIFYTTIANFTKLRYRLLPYIYSQAWQTSKNGYTLMRGLPMDFPNDYNVFNINDSYMFGNAILIKPVTEEMFYRADSTNLDSTRVTRKNSPYSKMEYNVYLPTGTGWIDFWTGKYYNGGQNLPYKVSLSTMPLFVKEGSIIPFGPFIQYSTEKPADPIELRIYPGNDGQFVLYEDENDNYNYEKGIYSTITFNWNDKKRELTIAEREGEFTGMLKERTINIVIVNELKGIGTDISKNIDRTIKYYGNKLKINL